MAELQKFMFDVSFDEETLARQEAEAAAQDAAADDLSEPEEDAPSFTEEQLDAARDEGFEAGKQAGIREAADAIETKINDALGMIGMNFEELFKRQTLDTADIFTDAVKIAVAIARKSFPLLNETHGFPEIEYMVKDVLAEVLEEPRVIIHISPVLKAKLDERIATIAKESNFEGQVIILEDDDMAPGDCRVAWSSGLAERDTEGTLGKIDQIVADNLGTVKDEVVEHVETKGVDAPSSPSMPSSPSVPPSPPAPAAETAPDPEPEPQPEPEMASEPDQTAESATPETPDAVEPAMPEATIDEPTAPEPAAPDDLAAAPAGAPPTPSADLIADTDDVPEPAENLDSDPADALAEAADDDDDDGQAAAEPSVPAEEVDDMMAARLQAGPGNMEPAPNAAILDDQDGGDAEADAPSGSEDDASVDFDPDATIDSMPPMGPNR